MLVVCWYILWTTLIEMPHIEVPHVKALICASVTGNLFQKVLFQQNKIFSENFGPQNDFSLRFCSKSYNALNNAFWSYSINNLLHNVLPSNSPSCMYPYEIMPELLLTNTPRMADNIVITKAYWSPKLNCWYILY